MTTFTLRIPMISSGGPLEPTQATREFQGVMPTVEAVAFVANIIREGLEIGNYPEYRILTANSDEWLVQQIALVTSVPDDVWIRNGFYPLGDWKE
jgi:hypothetical protein